MTAMTSVLAVALLVAPPETPEPAVTAEQWPTLQVELQQVAIEWEILDPREVRYVLARHEDFESDLNLLRRRYQELANAPRVQDSERFPERGIVNQMLSFNRGFRRHLEGRQSFDIDRWDSLREVQRETDRLYQVWDAVRDARCEFYYVTVRRQALKRLTELLGPDDYCAANLPPHVPVWRFREMD